MPVPFASASLMDDSFCCISFTISLSFAFSFRSFLASSSTSFPL
jgi:hypothetical protein